MGWLRRKPNPSPEVLVGDYWFPVEELPQILANYMRSSDEAHAHLKAAHILNERLRAELAGWDSDYGACADVPDAACRVRSILGWRA